ncbi:uncharacterized protein SPAPADRAFT_60893 [Spathaspora passalidarum NRRL Y-27907]|uniref:JAB1/MPN/MOV34 metalloenzyme domain-containing protein n=1 Tax=Spathaspora passalidarum (strain NRRL Y-27907 / 11-Y1) TaxID=619300 RepID=G3AK95_SPAPN|nr:uncharacterized protein SPAPADRAFT_60893 [Spathaspora passalidarum NRRL Y-27907]EGW33554.1 hypothetical protein SPAPADRAFT_60893 [Spathaspora passalidarum NRRL Y-27907]
MTSTILIQLHPVVLFNISDIISRENNSPVGVLLGHAEGENLVVKSSFEIVQDYDAVDLEYLYKRFNQFKVVFPQCKVIGIYQILAEDEGSNDLVADAFTISVVQQIQQFVSAYEIPTDGPLFYTIFDKSNLKHYQHGTSKLFKSYTFETSQPLRTIISTTDTESIAASTIQKNKNYFANSKEKESRIPQNIPVAKHTAELTTSLNQLQERVVKILTYLEQERGLPETREARQEKINIENMIVHLSNKLTSFKQTSQSGSDAITLTKLQASNLALLTKQLTLLEQQKVATTKSILSNDLHHQGLNRFG